MHFQQLRRMKLSIFFFSPKMRSETVYFWRQRGICENPMMQGNFKLIFKILEILALGLQ
jgi:hypothetical protein